ncbi:MAG: hypothetical protein WCD89_12715 [Anaerocolumna sp.]
MTINTLSSPVILVDLKKYRIRVHKNTLHSIGDPNYILLLVNPEERTLAILPSNSSDLRAHQITKASLVDKKSFELYSSSLVKSLRDLCSSWQDNQSYRLYGEIISNEGVAQFHMDNSVLVNCAKS